MLTIDELSLELFALSKARQAAERREKEIKAELDTLTAPWFASGHKLMPVADGRFDLKRIPGSTSSINREKLLQRGVAPDVIAFATTKTEWHRYAVAEAKTESK